MALRFIELYTPHSRSYPQTFISSPSDLTTDEPTNEASQQSARTISIVANVSLFIIYREAFLDCPPNAELVGSSLWFTVNGDVQCSRPVAVNCSNLSQEIALHCVDDRLQGILGLSVEPVSYAHEKPEKRAAK
jgi:hypothetical protein